jgi:integrase
MAALVRLLRFVFYWWMAGIEKPGSYFGSIHRRRNQVIHSNQTHTNRIPWNKGKLVGQKLPLKLRDIWSIRIRLQLANKSRDLALFNLAIDSKLRSCDLVKLRVIDVTHGGTIQARAMVMQQKTDRPVQFEITEQTRESVGNWIEQAQLTSSDFLFKSQFRNSPHLSTRQYESPDSICSHRWKMGHSDRSRSNFIWNAFNETN